MSKPLHIVVTNASPSVRSQIQELGDETRIRVEDLPTLDQSPGASSIDVLVLGEESRLEDLAILGTKMDLSKTVVLAGPVPTVESITAIRGLLENGKAGRPSSGLTQITLEDYVKSKFGEFVRAMKASSSRSLYSTLIQAVERPLIELALRETHGNQIQAAQLLGLNRNTLRKKILEYKISVKRRSRSAQDKESA